MKLWLIRLGIDTAALGRWSAERGVGWSGRHYDEGAALHHLLGECFGAAALQPFRLMALPRGRKANLYAYAREPAESLRAAAEAAMLPETTGVLDLSSLEGKAMPAGWRQGQRLGFDLRLRPVVQLASPLGRHGKGDECDAFLAEALRRHGDDREGMKHSGRTREAVYRDWLAARLAPSAALESDARLVRFSRRRVVRGGRSVEGPDAVMQGTLSVRNPEAFSEMLERGVGRHRAYGCGMLLLRPPGRLAPRC
ncbi:MAG: type I-E CRISPR-associated protein Cas6/Cse3/CasE [Alphaproteobacteria bacterium]|nr:MAG: type I-E CRISPR-associated protein Cas6/Cse3/CasE [Alphaproteobacteria bacterium]